MQRIIDFHTHAFPDEIAAHAMAKLHSEVDITSYLDGRLSSLIDSMDKCNIEKSVVCSIATAPSQFNSIFKWSQKIASDRIVPFPSVHPSDKNAIDHIKQIKSAGFKGIKMHPYYQEFILNEDRMNPIYEQICQQNMILVVHTGYDIAFEHVDKAGPARILDVITRYPDLKIITTHMGAWEQWDQAEKLIIGRKIYMGISFSINELGFERARRMILAHPEEYVLFSTDSPWDDQKKMVKNIMGMHLGEQKNRLIMYENAENLLEWQQKTALRQT